jgi:hypothetical protein
MRKLNTVKKTINGIQVSCTQFGSFEQAELGDRLLILLAPAGGKLAGIGEYSDAGDLGPAFEAVLRQMTPALASQLRLDIVAGTQVQVEGGRWLQLDSKDSVNAAFGGDLKSFWQTVMFAVEVNFGPLFDGARSVIKEMLAAKLPEEPEPEKSDLTSVG